MTETILSRIHRRQRLAIENDGPSTKGPVTREEHDNLLLAVQELMVIIGEQQEAIASLSKRR